MKIKIGTRKSRLAMAQTKMVSDALLEKYPSVQIEIVPVTTKGDVVTDRPLSAIGGKGIFVNEIESALQSGKIDIAVHSAKDLPAKLGNSLEISGVLGRGNYRDVLVSSQKTSFDVNSEFIVGTGSLRRRNNLLRTFPNVQFRDIRGNVDTRLRKMESGDFDAVVLAAAGLERLEIDLEKYSTVFFDYNSFLPAPCQGIIAVESRKNDFVTPFIKSISHRDSFLCFETERKVIELSGGDCSTPLGAYSCIKGEKIYLTVSLDSKKVVSDSAEISKRFQLAEELISRL